MRIILLSLMMVMFANVSFAQSTGQQLSASQIEKLKKEREARSRTCQELAKKIQFHVNSADNKDMLVNNNHLTRANLLMLNYAQTRCSLDKVESVINTLLNY